MDGFDICSLQKLLSPPKDDSDSSDDDLPKSSIAKLGPGSIGATRAAVVTNQIAAGGDGQSASQSIWNENEIPKEVVCDATQDPRKMPEYEIKFRQLVSAEDVYLQLGNKTPSSASCEEMVVVVQLPGEKLENVDVNVTKQFLDLRSNDYRLNLALPHPVDPESGKAQWLAEISAIKVTMKMVREFDYVNF